MSEFETLRLAYMSKLSAKGRFYVAAHPEFVAQLERATCLLEFELLPEKLYALKCGLIKRPRCYCGEKTRLQASNGFGTYCSKTCSVKDPQTSSTRTQKRLAAGAAQKAAQTNRERHGPNLKLKQQQGVLAKYGVRNVFSNLQIREKIAQTSMKRYGHRHASQAQEIKNRIAATCLKKYGTTSSFGSDLVRAKIKKTNLHKYGVMSSWSNAQVREKINSSFISQHQHKRSEIIQGIESACNCTYVDGQWLGFRRDYRWQCNLCQQSFLQSAKSRPICPNCKPKSKPEQKVTDFIKTLGVQFLRNDRQVIKPLELDFVIPEKSVAIEVNGVYWHHSESSATPLLVKTELAEAAGYQLLHFWDFEINNKFEIVASIIRSKLGLTDRIYARKTVVVKLSQAEARDFVQRNHLNGYAVGSYYGLKQGTMLVAAIGINKNRFGIGTELVRFCTKLNITVVGGLSKLLKVVPGELVSYADRRVSTGRAYHSCGFKLVKTTTPGYSYFKAGQILARQHAWRTRLPTLLGDKFDDQLTESLNMQQAGYLKLIDCGNKRYQLGMQ